VAADVRHGAYRIALLDADGSKSQRPRASARTCSVGARSPRRCAYPRSK